MTCSKQKEDDLNIFLRKVDDIKMKLSNNILENNFNYGEDAYYLTEMDRLDYAGSAIFNTLLTGDKLNNDYNKLKKIYNELNWHSVTYNELTESLNENSNSIIVISPKAKAYKKSLENKYKKACIVQQK